jgi:hypothetical protein
MGEPLGPVVTIVQRLELVEAAVPRITVVAAPDVPALTLTVSCSAITTLRLDVKVTFPEGSKLIAPLICVGVTTPVVVVPINTKPGLVVASLEMLIAALELTWESLILPLASWLAVTELFTNAAPGIMLPAILIKLAEANVVVLVNTLFNKVFNALDS